MSARFIMPLLLVIMAVVSTATAAPGTSWDQADAPAFVLVADFSPDRGLEGLYWDFGRLEAVSFRDYHSLGTVPSVGFQEDTTVAAVDLDGDSYAEIVVFEKGFPDGSLVFAFKHNGSTWSEVWVTSDAVSGQNSDVQMVHLGDSKMGSYLMATGTGLDLCDPATGTVLWSSLDPADGPGEGWSLVNWTLADFDQDAGGDEELLIEFRNDTGSSTQLWMIDEAAVASATPLRSTVISLGASRPNPMFGATTIQFELQAAGLVHLNIYDVGGRRVATLANRTMSAGAHVLRWDGKNRDGARVAQGVYFYELKAGGQQRTRKMVVVR